METWKTQLRSSSGDKVKLESDINKKNTKDVIGISAGTGTTFSLLPA